MSTAVLFFHGLRSSSASLAAEARVLTAAGLTVLTPDAPHHGARLSPFLATMPDTSTAEGYRRLLVILREARDEVPMLVDRALAEGHARVAIAGVSLGGFIALAAGAIEPRLCAIASLLGSPDWTPHEGEAAANVALFAEALAEAPCHHPEAFPPRPLLLLNGAFDTNVPPGGARAFVERLRPMYAGAEHALVHREYDCDHFAPPETWSEMIATAATFLSGVGDQR